MQKIHTKRAILLFAVGLLVFIGYLYFFVDISELFTVIQTINLFYYVLSFAALLLSMFFASMLWYRLMHSLSIQTAFKRTFLISWIAVFIDTLIPAENIAGDLSKIRLIGEETGAPTGRISASVIGHKIFDMITTFVTFLASIFLLFVLGIQIGVFMLILLTLVVAGSGTFLVLILLLSFKRQLAYKITDALLRFSNFILRGRLNLPELKQKAREILEDFHGAIRSMMQHPRRLIITAIFSGMSWFFVILSSYFVFVSFGYAVSFVLVTIVFSITVNVQNIPIGIPAEIGVVEVVMTTLYSLLGVPISIGATATILIRVLWTWVRFLIGFIAFQWIVVKGGSATDGSRIS